MDKRILVIEDDPAVTKLVKTVLERDQYFVKTVDNGEDGEGAAFSDHYDIIILDLGLPDKDGLEICKNLRNDNILTPILILSGDQQTEQKVKGLKYGADDYLTKPFKMEELKARIEAITRRARNTRKDDKLLICGELELDMLERQFRVTGHDILLTNNEFNLMAYFMKNPDRIIPRDELAAKVWDIHFDTQTNYINVYISYLRKKIRDFSEVEYIETVRKKGFRLNCDV